MVFVARVAQQIIAELGPNPAQYLFKLLVGAPTGPVQVPDDHSEDGGEEDEFDAPTGPVQVS